MSEARDNVIPFSDVPGFARTSGLGGSGLGAVGGVSVAVDTGDLTVEAGVDEQGNPVVEITAPAVHTHDDENDVNFYANLADRPGIDLPGLANEVIEGATADEQSRQQLIQQYVDGLDLLGSKLEEVSASQGQKKGLSRIGHPLLTEAMVKYWSGAMAEALPAAGPAKVATLGSVGPDEEQRAQDFADMMNYYLTEVATEFYPDTSQMFMHQAYIGNAFKKLYRCPRRQRPVSEQVRLIDLIVSEEAVDLDTAIRVTHQIFMAPSQLKRMQIMGTYRNFTLPSAGSMTLAAPARLAIKHLEGLNPQALRPQDGALQVFEQDLDLDQERFAVGGTWERAAPEGLPLPYKVTIEAQSRQVLGIWRNWENGDGLYRKDNMYVRYGMIPGMGFHNWGFLQLLGNHTRALRAVWRLLIDSGMFSLFPGGVKIKGARQTTNEIAPGPGEWVDIDVPGATDIRQILMPMPYKQLDAVYVEFMKIVQDGAEKLGGMVMLEVGEGRTNMPVGTVMSMVEQQTQLMAAVYKANHRSQKEELLKLRKLFAQNPEDLWRLNPDPKRRYETRDEFMDLNLLPASDPNVPSHVAKIMQIVALLTIVQQTPTMWDMQEVLRRALNVLRIGDPQTLLLRPEQIQASQPGPPPPDPAKMAKVQGDIEKTQLEHQGRMAELQTQGQQHAAEMNTKAEAAALESQDRQADRMAHLQEAAMKTAVDREKIAADFAAGQMPPPAPAGGTSETNLGPF